MALWECTRCGQQASKWLGRCPGCGAFNTFEQQPGKLPKRKGSAVAPVPLNQIGTAASPRLSTGIAACDRVLGGGLVPGSLVLLAGEPGVGKSSLLLQVANRMAEAGPVLYVTAEESLAQVALRAQRLGCRQQTLLLLAEASVERVLDAASQIQPKLLVLDSVQTMRSENVPSIPGSVTQVREVACRVADHVKKGGPPAFLVGHVTKEGSVAGPKSLEHMVDVVLEFSGSSSHAHRILRSTKNRFGPALELALFAMGEEGLTEVANPSLALLADRVTQAPGSAVAVLLQGLSPLLLEIQALVSRSPLLNPRRVAQGYESSRLALLLAVMEQRLGMRLGDRDVFVNVVGGLEVEEPAADLAVVAAVLSSFTGKPLPHDAVFFAEVGLLGELRAVGRGDARLREAQAMGFHQAFVAKNLLLEKASPLTLHAISDLPTLAKALELLN